MMHPSQIQNGLALAIETAIKRIPQGKKLSAPFDIELDSPKDPRHGDLATNVAMRLAGNFSMRPIELAELIKENLGNPAGFIGKIEAVPPGFINFYFSNEYFYFLLGEISKEKDSFGKSTLGRAKKVNIEFVSANPTGPLTIAHGRQAAVGSALANIMEFAGYKVCKEYFINDVGNQIELLGKSIYAHYARLNGRDAETPEDGYQGEYIKDIAEKLKGRPKSLEFISAFGVKSILDGIKSDLERFGVSFDKWSSQSKFSDGKIKKALQRLKAAGYVYEKEGATWFKSTAFGDEKDRVIIKSDGKFTYLAPDIAYHSDKYGRRFDTLIDIWGPDHHGYIARLKASVEALGYDRGSLSVLIVQLATLFRGGVAVSMSTRKGEFITLREIMDEVGCDVAKFFFLTRKLDSHLDFDLEVAKKNAPDNPVYYIQYAHARIASILKFSSELEASLRNTRYDPELLKQPEEIRLLRMLCQFPRTVEAGAKTLEPYRVIEYLNTLAKTFHSFYSKHRVVSENDLALTKARLTLVKGVKIVLANGLGLLGISFPERM